MNLQDTPAYELAAYAHRNQVRKGSGEPYIMHPLSVAQILMQNGVTDEDILFAALLHDTLEDTDLAASTIEEQFGSRVLALVQAVTEQKLDDDGTLRPWETRKQEHLAHAEAYGQDAVLLMTADCLHTVQSQVADVQEIGKSLWERFRRGPEQQLWYHHQRLALAQRMLGGDHALVQALACEIDQLEELVG